MPPEDNQTQDVFDPEFLESAVLAELEGLGWIRVAVVSDEVRRLITSNIKKYLSAYPFRNETSIEKKLASACDARRSVINNPPELTHKNLTANRVEKPQKEGLSSTLYPLVYIRIIEAHGFPLIETLKKLFLELDSKNRGLSKKAFLAVLRANSKLEINDGLDYEPVINALQELMQTESGLTRLGEIIFENDTGGRSRWHEFFTSKNTVSLTAAPQPAEVAFNFFLGLKYFTGNPHTLPGLFIKFKKTVIQLIEPEMAQYLVFENRNNSFKIKRKGAAEIDTLKIEQFADDLMETWVKKYPQEVSLVIEIDFTQDGNDD